MRAKKLDTQSRRKQITEAALRLAGRKSFAEIGMSEIAREVKIVPSGLYRHFSGKEEILSAILDLVRFKLQEIVEEARGQSVESLQQLKILIGLHAGLLSDNPGIPEIVFPHGIFGIHPSNDRKIREIMRNYLSEVMNIIERGQEEGQIRKDIRPEVIARLFFGLVLPSAIMMSKRKGTTEIVRHVREAWPLFEAGVLEGAN